MLTHAAPLRSYKKIPKQFFYFIAKHTKLKEFIVLQNLHILISLKVDIKKKLRYNMGNKKEVLLSFYKK
jgi:hypothetical protein